MADITRIPVPLNHAATKRFILATVKKERPGWNCTRVSGKALDQYTYWVESELRGYAREMSSLQPQGEPCLDEKLLTWGTCRTKLLELARARVNWLMIGKVNDVVLLHLERRLRLKIQGDIHQHPSMGSTFCP